MIELIIVACLGSGCREFAHAEQFATQTACVMQAQILTASWAGDHPQYRIKAIGCRPLKARRFYVPVNT
jgi:hypothetical protein